jgi:hypothetical protein
MAVVVDTDAVSFLYKRDTRAELYRPHLTSPPFLLSMMTLAELASSSSGHFTRETPALSRFLRVCAQCQKTRQSVASCTY